MPDYCKEKIISLQCTAAGLHNAIPTDLLRAGLCAALVSTYLGSVSLASLSVSEQPPTRTLADGLAKISAAREHDGVSLFALSAEWEEKCLKTYVPPDGIPQSINRCAGGSGSRFLFDAKKCVLEGGAVSTHFARSRTLFIPKSSTAEDNGLIVRSPDALRPLTLCNGDCKIITTAIYFGLHGYSI